MCLYSASTAHENRNNKVEKDRANRKDIAPQYFFWNPAAHLPHSLVKITEETAKKMAIIKNSMVGFKIVRLFEEYQKNKWYPECLQKKENQSQTEPSHFRFK